MPTEELIIPYQNTGLIPELSPSVWLGGDRIPYQIVLESGDWRPYVSEHEKQKDPVECMGCVSFSLNNNLECQHNFKGIKINLSDKALAKMSGTQMNGNTFERVADTARNVGVLFEAEWPNSPKAQTWAEYYKTIPQEILNKARKVDFNYEVVPRSTDWEAQLKKYLKQCPLWITIPYPDQNHAITLLHVENGQAYVQDHYNYPIRKMAVSKIALAAKVVINKYIGANMARVTRDDKGTYRIEMGVDGRKISLGINDTGFANSIIESGEPIVQISNSDTKQIGIIEKGLIIDQE